jgi:ABC-type branched-subunit amino acid transport system ATPase component/MFS family permease
VTILDAPRENRNTHRDFTPSPREVDAGMAAPEVDFDVELDPRAESDAPTGFRAAAREAIHAIDPRSLRAEGAPMRPVLLFGLLSLLGAIDIYGFQALAPFIQADMRFDFSLLLTLTTMINVGITITSPLAGYLADRVRRVWMVRAGDVLGHLGSLLVGLAGNPAMLMGARLVASVGPGVELPARLPLISDYYRVKQRPRVFIFLQAMQVIGITAGVIVILLLMVLANVSWRVIMIGSALLGLGLSALLWTLREPVRGAVDREEMGADAAAAQREAPRVPLAEAWRICRSIRSLRRLWYATPFIFAGQGSIGILLYYVVQQRVLRHELGGPGMGLLNTPYSLYVVLALPAVISFVFLSFAAPLAQRLMQRRPGRMMTLVALGLVAQAVSFICLVATPWFIAALLVLFIGSAIASTVLPLQQTLLSAVIPAHVRGIGFQTIAPWQLAGLLITPIAGAFADAYGPSTAIFVMIPVFLLGAAITASGAGGVERDVRNALAASMADDEVRRARAAGGNRMLVCRQVEVSYSGSQVLFGVDLDVDEGELLAVLGTNGAGKSTLLRAICCIQEASGGAVFLDGRDVTHRPPSMNARDGVVFLPGGRAIFPTLSVEENLRAAAWLYRDEPEYVRARTEEVLDHFPQLRDRLQTRAGDLSGGEQQMVALGQSFLMRPRLLMIDELSLGLAPAVVERLLGIVRAINAQGTTVILVEQSLNVALTVARRAVFLDKGEVRFDGTPEELLARPDLVRAVFLGGGGAGVAARPRRPVSLGGEREQVLQVEAVRVGFGGVQVLQGVSLQVRAGEVVGIVGPNGAGKTTLFDVISGFVVPQSGSVRIRGTEAGDRSPDARSRLGLSRSFQDTRLFPSLTVREAIAVALEKRLGSRSAVMAAAWLPPARESERRAWRRVDTLVELLGLGAFADKFVSELSTGSRRLVDIACVMASEPRILLLDEPSSGLAQAETEMLAPTVRRLAADSGCGILAIEHDIPLVTAMADRLVAMELGAVIAEGEPQDVVRDPRVVGSYLNASDAVIRRSGDLFDRALLAVGAEEPGE